MTISFRRYVDITSGVAGTNVLSARALIGRLFTNNPLLPPESLVEMDNADDVGAYFGTASEEYFRAQFYFGWISKNVTRARRICFARFVSAAVAPLIYGAKTAKLLATFQSITAGQFTLALGGVSHTFGPLNFSSDVSLAAVAARVQAAIQAQSGTLWSAATVVFNASRSSFDFVGGVATSSGTTSILVTDGAQNLAAALGWLTGAILGEGSAAVATDATLSASASVSNNFGSFLFMPALALSDIVLAAAWNATQNVMFQYTVPVAPANAAAWSAALIGYAGTELTVDTLTTEYPEMDPMIILAATNYDGLNATQNYMYQQFPGQTPTVTSDPDADTYDALRINYYGLTQEEGQLIALYQRGLMMGGATAPLDMNTYANEQWLKSKAGAAIMNLQLALAKISANTRGRRQIMTQLQAQVIGSSTTPGTALGNGTISVGKPLNSTQQLTVTDITNDPNAWRQVQGSGYWLDVVIAPYTNDTTGLTEWKASYTLVYAKDDVIRKVEGSHVLI